VLNDAAFDYMRNRNLPAALIARLANEPLTTFANKADWLAHLDRLEFAAADVTPNPILIATEGALWGSIQTHSFLSGAVVLSDDAGQFNIATHALCWVHAERLVHKLNTFTDQHRLAQSEVRGQIWDLYADLKAYKLAPTPEGRAALSARPSVPTTVRHLPPGSLPLRAPKDRLAHAHAPHNNRWRGWCRHERRP
jgi:hypothetical protein